MITPLFVTSVTKNSVKTEFVIIVICLVSLEVLLMKSGNLKYKIPKFFPVVFHNLSGYDSHLFIKTLENSEGDIFLVYQIMKKTTFLSRNRSLLTNLLIRKEKR